MKPQFRMSFTDKPNCYSEINSRDEIARMLKAYRRYPEFNLYRIDMHKYHVNRYGVNAIIEAFA